MPHRPGRLKLIPKLFRQYITRVIEQKNCFGTSLDVFNQFRGFQRVFLIHDGKLDWRQTISLGTDMSQICEPPWAPGAADAIRQIPCFAPQSVEYQIIR